jgi:hypothetical protein
VKTIADFVLELTKAAHDVHSLPEGEKLRLLGRAYVTIREGWQVLGESARLRETAAAMDLVNAGELPMHLHDDEMKALLLEAAKVIREIQAAIEAQGNEHSSPGSGSEGRLSRSWAKTLRCLRLGRLPRSQPALPEDRLW